MAKLPAMLSPAREVKPVTSVVRCMLIMDALSQDTRPRGISELARELGLPRSTVYGLCHTLADGGVLTRVNRAAFQIGPQVLAWSNAFEGQNSIAMVFAALADAREDDEAMNLSILSGRDVMYIACRPGSDPLAVRFREGLKFPAPHTATGKAILSTLPDEEVATLLAGDWPEPPSPNSLRTIDELLVDLAQTRRRGYAIDSGQLRGSLVSCGAPVFEAASGGRAVAGVSVAMLEGRARGDRIKRAGSMVIEFAAEFSRRLGAM
jgi:IclR family transcriptional regulator, blcABC operon repressor